MSNKVNPHEQTDMDKPDEDKDKDKDRDKDKDGGNEDRMESVDNGKPEGVELLDILKDRTANKQIELIHAALRNNNFNTARLLVTEAGLKDSEVNWKGKDGETVLHIVTASQNSAKVDMIQWLISQHQADPTIQNKHGISALQLAIDLREDETVLAMLQSNQVELKSSLLMKLAKLDGCKALEFFLGKNPAALKVNDIKGDSVLHVAVEYGTLETIEAILKRDKDLIAEVGKLARTAVHVAAYRGDLDILCLLLEKGASVNTPALHGSALCIAALKGHEALVSHLLTIKDIDLRLTNYNGETALHLAVRGGHLGISALLSHQPGFPVAAKDNINQTVLHYVAQFATRKGWEVVVDDLVKRGVSCLEQDTHGCTPLHLAITHQNENITKYLLKLLEESEPGLESPGRLLLQALGTHDVQQKTPFRVMTKAMPGLAKEMLDSCIWQSQDSDGVAVLNFDFSLLEDTFDVSDGDGRIDKDAMPYCKNYALMKENHPLNIIAKKEQHDLLAHPVLKLLLRRKWTWASTLYIFFMLFYVSHVVSVSVYMITASPPFQINASLCEDQQVEDVFMNLWNEQGQGSLQTGLTAAVGSIAAFGIIAEVVQLIMSGTERLRDIHNILDWFTFVSAILIVVDFTDCKTRTDWQWQLGVACVFIAWMNFLFYLRKAPKIGIYIAMIAMIFETFMQFFAVFFLFILAFAITFYLLLQNQFAFRDVFVSIMKTWVMMIGEMDFTDIFLAYHEDSSHEVKVYFPEITYMVFIVFLMLLSLIIMNLLTGLAIRDVNQLLKDSVYQVTAMQISLALDIEFANPVWCHRKIVRRRETLRTDHRRGGGLRAALSRFYYGPLSAEQITREAMAIVSGEGGEGKTANEPNQGEAMKTMMLMMQELVDKVNSLEQRQNKAAGSAKGRTK